MWSEKVRCSSKMKPRLRAECTVSSEQELILASCRYIGRRIYAYFIFPIEYAYMFIRGFNAVDRMMCDNLISKYISFPCRDISP